ncbi:protein DpdD [Chloroflexota bacterium]
MSNSASDIDTFLGYFFGEGNDLDKNQIVKGNTPISKCVQAWLKDYQLNRRVIILPRQQGKDLYWYAITCNETNFRDIREQLMAFVGHSFSAIQSERFLIDKNDNVESAILNYFNPDSLVIRFKSAQNESGRLQLIDSLNLLLQVYHDAEIRPPDVQRATGRVLRDFYIALTVGNRDDAEVALLYLRKHQRLDALNIQFLEVKLRLELGLWQEILLLSNLREIIYSRHPRSVSQAIIKAIYQEYLYSYEVSKDINGACDTFIKQIRPQFNSLFDSLKGLTDVDVLKSFMLAAITNTPQRTDLCEAILGISDIPETEYQYLKSLSAKISEPTQSIRSDEEIGKTDSISKAWDLINQGDYDNAIEYAINVRHPVEKAKLLLECSFELQMISIEQQAKDAVEVLTEEERGRLFHSRKYQDFWQSLTFVSDMADTDTTTILSVPGGWLEWFELLSDPSISDKQILQYAELGTDEWSIDGFINEPDIVEKCCRALNNATKDTLGRDRLYETIPHLLRFLESDSEFPRTSFKEIYEIIRMELSYSCETGTDSDFIIFSDLCEIALKLGVKAEDYKALIEEVSFLWSKFASLSNLLAILDILDKFMYYQCSPSNEGDRSNFAIKVFNRIIPWITSGRINTETYRFIQQLSTELDLSTMFSGISDSGEDLIKEEIKADPLSDLSGTVAVYTLLESAGIRVRDILKRRSPNCKVELNHDKVGTDSLKELSRNADIFIITTRCAKHAATTFIENIRGSKPILRPRGKGTTSIIYELARYVTNSNDIIQ